VGVGDKRRVAHDAQGEPSSGEEMPSKRRKAAVENSDQHLTQYSPASPVHSQPNSVVDILRDLSIEASGGFIGAASEITMGRMIASIVQAKEHSEASNMGGTWEHLSPKSANTGPVPPNEGLEILQMSPITADRLFNGYIRHISTRWPVLQTPFIRLLHAERETLTDAFL
jgi:hypothetical protein